MDDVTGERWLPVVGFEGLYDVSDWGRVRSLDRLDILGRPLRGRIMRPQRVSKYGHLKVNLRKDGNDHQCLVHRLVMEAFAGPCPSGLDVCHGDGNPANNRRANLRYDTKSANNHDAVSHGTHYNASKTYCARAGHPLTPDNVRIGSHGDRNCRACGREQRYEAWKRTQARMATDPEFRAAQNAKSAERARRARARRRGDAG